MAHRLTVAGICLAIGGFILASDAHGETLAELQQRLAKETRETYLASPFAALSTDYFARFSREDSARPSDQETLIDSSWKIALPKGASPLAKRMAGHLREFLGRCMKIEPPLEETAPEAAAQLDPRRLVLTESGGGDAAVAESFTLDVRADAVILAGRDANGLRDGIVRLVDLMGLRRGPILTRGKQVYRPKLAVRLGSVPFCGQVRDLVFFGNNAVMTGGSLHELSVSDAIPGLAARRRPERLAGLAKLVRDSADYGLHTFAIIETRKKFPRNDPVFQQNPDIRGALTWSADGEHVLCTEHPLVRKYLCESIAGLFEKAPGLDGVLIIIGGEGFYHCFMRAHGVAKGHTNCPRCEKLGPDAVVSNLCNYLAEAARKVNPKAEIIAWPYSAVHVWSADADQSGLIARLKGGTGILAEVEKDEYVTKPLGVRKHLWDYSIDMVGLGPRARRQTQACKKAGIPIYLKSEPEAVFEGPGLPHVPALDRWLGRAAAMADSGAAGSFNFPCFRGTVFGTSVAEAWKYANWSPSAPAEEVLTSLARRIAGGAQAGDRLRQAWRHVSESIQYSPELPPYYVGPYYLGPAQPMCADRAAKLPEVFYGRFLFRAEATDAKGLALNPTFMLDPSGNAPVFAKLYRQMADCLAKAVAQLDAAAPPPEGGPRAMFDSEASAIRWFTHCARTQANFYESCLLRNELTSGKLTDPDKTRQALDRWEEVLKDEQANAAAGLKVMEADVRLDFYYGGDHTFSHGAEMIRAKLKLLEREIEQYLPALRKRLLPPTTATSAPGPDVSNPSSSSFEAPSVGRSVPEAQ